MTTFTLLKTKPIFIFNLFCFLLFFSTNGFSQTVPSIQWQKSLGGDGDDVVTSIKATPDGGYIVAGFTLSNDGDVSGNDGNSYDSSGFTINHIDTVNVQVTSLDTLKGFYISPKSVYLDPKQNFIPEYNAIFSHYVGIINNDNSSLQFIIGDSHVINYIDSLHEFISKDTGSTYIIFSIEVLLIPDLFI